MTKLEATVEATKLAKESGVEMAVVETWNEHSGAIEFGYCPADAVSKLFPLDKVVERIRRVPGVRVPRTSPTMTRKQAETFVSAFDGKAYAQAEGRSKLVSLPTLGVAGYGGDYESAIADLHPGMLNETIEELSPVLAAAVAEVKARVRARVAS